MRYLVAVLLGALIMALLWGRYEAGRAEGWRDYAHRLESASQAAVAATKAMREAERKAYQEKAVEADASHRAALAGTRSDTARYIASHRVQPSRISTAQPIGEADDPAVPESVPPGVVMDQADVQTCGDLYAYSVAAYEWARAVGQ